MLFKPQQYDKQIASDDAKKIFIFSEGEKREIDYFKNFQLIDSKVNVTVYNRKKGDDFSPMGLFKIAQDCLIKTDENPKPMFELISGDEVWIVLDTDKYKNFHRIGEIKTLRESCQNHDDWFVAESNPCFEVWLHYHFFEDKPVMDKIESCSAWKDFVNKNVSGGFDSRKHAIFITEAYSNAEKNHVEADSQPHVGSTQVYLLGSKIYTLLKEKIDEARAQMNQ